MGNNSLWTLIQLSRICLPWATLHSNPELHLYA